MGALKLAAKRSVTPTFIRRRSDQAGGHDMEQSSIGSLRSRELIKAVASS